MKNSNKSESRILRQKAEDLLKKKPPRTVSQLSEVELIKLMYELDVRQLELELQQENIEQTEEKYQLIIQSQSEGISIVDENEIFEFANLAAEKIFETEPDALVGASLYDFLQPAEIEKINHQTGIRKKGIANTYELQIVTRKGNSRCIQANVSPRFDKNNNFLGSYGIFSDITARKEAETRLRDSENRLQILAEHSRVITWEVDASGLYTYISDVCFSVLGYEPEEITGKLHFYDLHPESGRDVFKAAAFKIFALKKSFRDLENSVESKDGQALWVLTSGVPILDNEGRLAGYRGSDTNITERKHAEESLRESEGFVRSITDTAQDAILVIDEKGLISYWNPAAEKILGYTRAEAIGKNLHAFIVPPRYHGRHMAAFPLFQRTGQGPAVGQTLDLEARRKDGNEISVQLSLSANKIKGAWHAVGILRDVTERIKSEKEIILKNEELHRLNAEKDKLFSIISHDLRGPFSGFLGLSNLLAESLPGMTKEEIQKMAGALRNSATNLFRLLENLLEWSRMQQNRIKFNPGLTLLMPLIDETMRLVADSANKKGIEISYDIPADLEVFADEDMLASTIRNLTSNAVKFTRKGGKIYIAAKPGPGHSVEISVRDTGIGMSPEIVNDLFRLDVQPNRRGTEDEPSSGLGLLLCKDFVEKHGGKIRVESEEGKGSTFCFTLPF